MNDIQYIMDNAVNAEDASGVSEGKEGNEKLNLPGYPDVLFELPEEQQALFNYKGDETNLSQRMRHKLWLVWQAWYKIRNDEKIIELISKIEDESVISYENMYFLSNHLVHTIDVLGRILSNTNITEELFSPYD